MKLINDQYRLAGDLDPLALCEKYHTPLYIYDAETIERQYRRLERAFDVPKLELHYAVKALSNINILRLMLKMGAGLDCVSINEVKLGLRAGFSASDITFTPNFADIEEMGEAVKLGVKIIVDSIPMLENWGLHFAQYPIGLRINPHILAGGNYKISTGHIDSKFGISFHQLPHAQRVIESQNLIIEGIHMHNGSDILDVGVFLAGAEILFDAAKKFPNIQYIDCGSGFKVPYKDDDHETDIEELGEKMSARFREFCAEYGRDLTLAFEPGKFLVSPAGYFFAKCTTVKQTTATVFAGLDTGLNHLIRPMMYGSYHKIVNVTAPTFKPRIYTVVGNICETDTFGADRRIPEVVEGDILCFFNAGAYGMSMASNYNSRFRPAEILILNGKDHIIRRRESMDDILANQIEIDI
jgi:diaminopimelate decarboxylase